MTGSTSKIMKLFVIVAVLIGVYLLLVYYKGGTAYVSPISSAFNNGVAALQARTNKGGATAYASGG